MKGLQRRLERPRKPGVLVKKKKHSGGLGAGKRDGEAQKMGGDEKLP